jgi:acetylornithine deacetylase/succinyl-diaminopimelate desuccinylase-like protein
MSQNALELHAAEEYYDERYEYILEDLKQFLSYKSISTDNAYTHECRTCANWVKGWLERIGLKSSIVETEGHPVVFAERSGDASLPTLLFYGHYDVQPVDPLHLWESDPFKPEIKDGRLFARGAADNKGQISFFIAAIEYLLHKCDLKMPLKILIEGEEEMSSPHLGKILQTLKDKLQSDILLVCDTGTADKDLGTVTMGLRGILHLEARLQGAPKDLHSGVHGGMALNPAVEMSKLIATLFDEQGRIAIEGYYDDIIKFPKEDLEAAAMYPITVEWYKQVVGVMPAGGEAELSLTQRSGFRPTIEVNGLFSGYTGEGFKTIIPSYAQVKLSSRIVKGQDPEKCIEQIKAHLIKHANKNLTLEIFNEEYGQSALYMSSNEPLAGTARSELEKICSKGALYMWLGASVPILVDLEFYSGAKPILVGFSVEQDNLHAPNESFMLEQHKKGFLFVTQFLRKINEKSV